MTRTTADARQADVIVVGAGPAGASAAYHLAEAGVDVLLLEKAAFPRDKICGDGLTPRAVRQLIGDGHRPRRARAGRRTRACGSSAPATGSSCPGPTSRPSRPTAWSAPAWTSTRSSPGTPRRPAPG